MGRLFGTDGVRGIAGTELNYSLAINIGRAAAMVLTETTNHRPRIVIGTDTRASADMLESALATGFCSVGADVMMLGVIPTPAVAYLVQKYEADAGVMISASHNPMEYNGIKLFSNEGYKLSDKLEEKIEAIVLDKTEKPPVCTGGAIGRITHVRTAAKDYVRHLVGLSTVDCSGLRFAIDCANGSASVTAPLLFAALGADCEILSAAPDGTNINRDCGSTHLKSLQDFVVKKHLDFGLAFDGDADRCLAVDENGAILDGDKLIAIFAHEMKKNKTLTDDTAVVTILSNLGFFHFAQQNDIHIETTKVGDRYVLESMRAHNYAIGGEQSGHIIFLHDSTTGDGELTAIRFISAIKENGIKASALASIMQTYPQVMVNVPVTPEDKEKLCTNNTVQKAIDEAEKSLSGDGRILLRASGTEPLIRVMVEGENLDLIEKLANDVANVVKAQMEA
ncbi:MAG TPA: phosphoglucosamine mutase [Ruminococcaceae bacterium]|mgnify:CR=1 FL=1|nr:phosphoglucosamine mutase [Oscillospiraceae bacterium]